jgi:hypothetical protein
MRLLRWMRPLPNNPKQLPNEWLYWKNPVFPMLVWKHLWTKSIQASLYFYQAQYEHMGVKNEPEQSSEQQELFYWR